MPTRNRTTGFTLIELSIVLVIIGLLIGGVLVGRDLIKAAEIRAQVSQIEKYNTATHTFKLKYGQLPGDMDGVTAAAFGFVARSGGPGRGDNNGVIYPTSYGASTPPWYSLYPWGQAAESLFFWEDLSKGGLIDGSFNTATDAALGGTTSSGFERYFPPAKIGNGNFVTIYSGGIYTSSFTDPGKNLLSISVPTQIFVSNYTSTPGMSAIQAYNIDTKIDDGMPKQGTLKAFYLNGNGGTWSPNAAADSSTTCYNTTSNTYSVGNGDRFNCGLSLRMQ